MPPEGRRRIGLPRVARRIGGVRADHAMLLGGSLVMSVGSVMPWIVGSTRFNGYLDWTGLDDTGEGAMLIAAAIVIALWVRVRGVLEEIGPGARFIPLVIGIASALLWVIAFRKVLYLSWPELEVGARPQPGLLVAALGILLAIAGGLLAATDPESIAAARAAAGAEKHGSGAGGGFGAASNEDRRGGGPPSRNGYSIVQRVDQVSPDDADDDDRRARG